VNKGCIAKMGTRVLLNARKNMFRKGKEGHGWFVPAKPMKVEAEGEGNEGGKKKLRREWVKKFVKKQKVRKPGAKKGIQSGFDYC
jgi:hypothetical protein